MKLRNLPSGSSGLQRMKIRAYTELHRGVTEEHRGNPIHAKH